VFGYYERDELLYASRTRTDFTLVTRARLFKRFKGLEIHRPRSTRGGSSSASWSPRTSSGCPVEQEKGRLKKLVAERDLEIEVMKEITQKHGQARRLVGDRCCTRPRY
jgi:hypothetical protein